MANRSEEVFQIFWTCVLDVRALVRLSRPVLPVEILLTTTGLLPLLVLGPQLVILLRCLASDRTWYASLIVLNSLPHLYYPGLHLGAPCAPVDESLLNDLLIGIRRYT